MIDNADRARLAELLTSESGKRIMAFWKSRKPRVFTPENDKEQINNVALKACVTQGWDDSIEEFERIAFERVLETESPFIETSK